VNLAKPSLDAMPLKERYIKNKYTSYYLCCYELAILTFFQEFRCPFENNCKIDAVTRRFCQKCRLKKCLDIGMKKEFIMSEEERTVKRRKIEENRMKKTKPGRTNNTKNNSKQLIHLLNSGGSRANQRKSDIKSEAESSFSDSDVTTSPLDNSSEGFHESPASSNKATITVISNHQQLTPENRGINKYLLGFPLHSVINV
jgi:nuclear receptor subfamily 1 group I